MYFQEDIVISTNMHNQVKGKCRLSISLPLSSTKSSLVLKCHDSSIMTILMYMLMTSGIVVYLPLANPLYHPMKEEQKFVLNCEQGLNEYKFLGD